MMGESRTRMQKYTFNPVPEEESDFGSCYLVLHLKREHVGTILDVGIVLQSLTDSYRN